MCLTPTQEIMTCDMVRRKTKEKRGAYMICRACGNTLPRRHCGLKCRKCHAWACNAACAGDVADLHCCHMAGVASHESQSQSCSQGARQLCSQRNTSIDASNGAGDGRPDGGRADGGRWSSRGESMGVFRGSLCFGSESTNVSCSRHWPLRYSGDGGNRGGRGAVCGCACREAGGTSIEA